MLHRGPRQVEAFQPPHAGALPLRQDFLLVGQIVGDGVGAATSHALSSVKRRERPVCDLITGSCLGPSGDGNNSDSENENAPRVFFAAQRKLSSVLAAKSALPTSADIVSPAGQVRKVPTGGVVCWQGIQQVGRNHSGNPALRMPSIIDLLCLCH